MTSLTSASGIMSMLSDEEPEVKIYALKKLNSIVDVFWPEISSTLERIEMLFEDPTFKHRELASLVASKVYYHLGGYDQALHYALEANKMFDPNWSSEYVDTILAKAIDKYIALRKEKLDKDGVDVEIPNKLETLVTLMFLRCMKDKQYKQAIGIALETQHIDVLREAIVQSDDIPAMLNYTYKVCMSLIENRSFRTEVLKELVVLYLTQLSEPDYFTVSQCLVYLDDPEQLGDILLKLVRGETNKKAEQGAKASSQSAIFKLVNAYQLCFDLYEVASQQFLQRIVKYLEATLPKSVEKSPSPEKSITSNSTETEESAPKPVDSATGVPTSDVAMEEEEGEGAEESEATLLAGEEEGESSESSKPPAEARSDDFLSMNPEKRHVTAVNQMVSILNGSVSINLHRQFLIRSNKTDPNILKQTREQVRQSICHTATVVANGFNYCGTTCDSFLRENLDWLSKANHWAKFTCTASLGVIHKAHENNALSLLSPYLPKDAGGSSTSVYTDGGGLYALGLIHSNHGSEKVIEVLLKQLGQQESHEVTRHGACLGIGLAAMATRHAGVYQALRQELYADNAVTGEAAGIAIGLVMLGSNDDTVVRDLLEYAKETQHEKIVRGLATGLALLQFGQLEAAEATIETLVQAENPILRWAGCYSIAMAYCGSGHTTAVQRLQHIGVSDVNNDVRRIAVQCLGFVLNAESCATAVSLLVESYNPHVRCGSAMALGIACAGSGHKEALTMLEKLCKDSTSFVRQAAYIASALILIQANEVTCPGKMKEFRSVYANCIPDKQEDSCAKFGAILAQGIIDAGGRNVTVSLMAQDGRGGHVSAASAVGLLVFCQFWYWYPLAHFLSLAFTPTCLIGLNERLEMPASHEFVSTARPSTFAYVPHIEIKSKVKAEKVETAVLSITERQKRKKKLTPGGGETSVAESAEKKEAAEPMELDKPASPDASKTGPQRLKNPARVVPGQLRFMSVAADNRYQPIRDLRQGGIVVMVDSRAGEKEEILDMLDSAADQDEAPPPQPFKLSASTTAPLK